MTRIWELWSAATCRRFWTNHEWTRMDTNLVKRRQPLPPKSDALAVARITHICALVERVLNALAKACSASWQMYPLLRQAIGRSRVLQLTGSTNRRNAKTDSVILA